MIPQANEQKNTILAIDDDHQFLFNLNTLLSGSYELIGVNDAGQAMAALKKQSFSCILLDMELPEIMGLDLLKIIKGLKPNIPVVMLTADKTTSKVVRAIQLGASNYVVKRTTEDFEDELRLSVEKAIEQQGLVSKVQRLEKKISEVTKSRYEIVGNSNQILKLKNSISKLKGHLTPVMILGESGTGKELVARALNSQESNGAERPFVSVNCAAIPESLAESELFGHVKGAFTGAFQQQEGKFIAANGGDIFLDEIGELPLSMQAKLLRVLQEKEVYRVGSNTGIKINVRVIAATNKNLLTAIAEGKFREDLFYRLAVMTLTVPALRNRKDDIPILVEHFLKDMGSHLKLSSEAMDLLVKNDWEGNNIRALRNCVERAMILAQADGCEKIQNSHVVLEIAPPKILPVNEHTIPMELIPERSEDICSDRLKDYTQWTERVFYASAYRVSDRNKTRLAEKLGVSRDFLHRKFKMLGVGDDL